MKVSGLEVRVTHRERCPYCHDAMGDVERIACSECGTPHHPACLEELGACTVLGCKGAVGRRPPRAGSVDETRARVHGRVERFMRNRRQRRLESEESVRRRLAGQPPFCGECLKEIRVFGCPVCGGPMTDECDGSARHCANLACHPYFDRLCDEVGAPIDHLPPWVQRKRKIGGVNVPNLLVGVVAVVLIGMAMLYFLGLIVIL